MEIRAFITHKKNEKYSDCQDSYCVNTENKSLAVSDGMSQSIFQKKWADILTSAYTDNQQWEPSKETDNVTVKNVLSDKWRHYVLKKIEEQRQEGKEMAAYRNERSLVEGRSAGATFLGIRFSGKKWEGDVLGDTCLIEVEDGEISRIETSQNKSSFDNTPDYYDSYALKPGKGQVKHIEGELNSNKVLLLVSDPFSDLLNEYKKKSSTKELMEHLLQLGSHEDFVALIDDWREHLGMHNDDSTLIIISDDNSDAFNIVHEDDINQLILNENEQEVTKPISLKEECAETSDTDEKEKDIVDEFITDLKDWLYAENHRKKYKKYSVDIKKAVERIFGKYNITKKQ